MAETGTGWTNRSSEEVNDKIQYFEDALIDGVRDFEGPSSKSDEIWIMSHQFFRDMK